MSKLNLDRSFRRNALSIALGLTLAAGAGSVMAQSAAGSVFGKTQAGASVTIENLDTGTSREISADAAGRFSATQLPTGRYRVTVAGQSRDVVVAVGTGTAVNFGTTDAATELGAVVVTGAGAINPIDVSSVESTTVFTAAQIEQLPVARDVTNVALLAPGTVRGDTGFGNLASFGGSSVAENGYYINGFDVTNIRNFVSYANLPFDAIGEQQVKTGGYGAEFGRALGGVINIVTKRGTNEWKGGISAYWTPGSLREPGKDVVSRDPADFETNDQLFVYRSDNHSDSFTYNVYGSGPIVKDKLFVFALLEGGKSSSDTYGRDSSSSSENDTPNGMVKLDWNVSDNHIVEFTGISNRTERDVVTYNNPDELFYTGEHHLKSNSYSVESGGEVYIGKYTGYLTDNFTLSAQYGHLESKDSYRTPEALPGAECPRVWDSRGANPGALVYRGCWNRSQASIRDPNFGPDTDERDAYRIDAEWRLGDHTLRLGLDHETFTSGHAGSIYTGNGVYYRYFSNDALGWFDLPPGTDFVRTWESITESGSYEAVNQAAYVEDHWQVTDTVLLYGGLRAETFENTNAAGNTFVESETLYAPRLGISWDVMGDSTMKVFGNAGRYYIPVAVNTNIRASSAEYFAETYYLFNGIDPVTFAPVLGDLLDGPYVNGSLTPPDPRTVAATNLSPMYQDEFIAGFQMKLGENWSIGVRGIVRDVKNGMDDYCTHNAFNQWAADNGFDSDFALDGDGVDMASCFMINPGEDVSLAMDPDNDGTLEVYNVSSSYLGLPKYQRKYRAVEFMFEKAFADKWYLQGSYTWSHSYGNVEGYVNSTLEQDDAGLTQDFDHEVFERGAYGDLPNDRRHTLKLFGVYELADEWKVSGNMVVQSGRPVNCNGYAPVNDLGIGQPDRGSLGAYGPSTFYCRNAEGELVLGRRGDRGRTPWARSFDVGLAYQPHWANDQLTLKVDVFNVFNNDTVTEYNETSATVRTQTTLDPNYLNDVNYQEPRSFRITARYQF